MRFRIAVRVGCTRRLATGVPDEWPSRRRGQPHRRHRTRLTGQLAFSGLRQCFSSTMRRLARQYATHRASLEPTACLKRLQRSETRVRLEEDMNIRTMALLGIVPFALAACGEQTAEQTPAQTTQTAPDSPATAERNTAAIPPAAQPGNTAATSPATPPQQQAETAPPAGGAGQATTAPVTPQTQAAGEPPPVTTR